MRTGSNHATGSSQAGFTLLEAIVTLIVVSLLVATLMQALGQAMGLRTRLLRFEGENRRAALQESWFREVTAGLQHDPLDEEGRALGQRDQLEYLTAAPLAAHGASVVRWWLDGGSLHYADSAANDVVIIRGPLRDAAFSYLDEAGAWRNDWRWAQHKKPPRLIRFTAATERGSIDWIVPIMADGLDPESLRTDDPSHGI